MIREDLTYGRDGRGDSALFIGRGHLIRQGFGRFDEATVQAIRAILGGVGELFFRLVDDGIESGDHGWVNQDGEVQQWG